MSLSLRSLIPLLATTAFACGDGSATPAPTLTRTTTEPAGANCAHGGTAVATGPDDDGDSQLGDDEVADVDYHCDGPVLTRQDVEPAGAQCDAGGTATHVGRDDDGDGALSTDEIEHTTYACDPSTVWVGDLTITAGTGSTIDEYRHIRVVTGSLRITGDLLAELPVLEIVRGNLAIDSVPSAALPALVTVGGDLQLGWRLEQASLPRLALVGGSLEIYDAIAFRAFEAPALESIGGDLRVRATRVTRVSLSALTSIGGDLTVTVARELSGLSLGSLTRIGGTLTIQDTDKLTSIPGLRALEIVTDIDLRYNPHLDTVALPALREVGRVRIAGGKTVALPALVTAVRVAVRSSELTTLDLGALTHAGEVVILTHSVPGVMSGSLDTVDLTALTSADVLTLHGLGEMPALVLPALTRVGALFLAGLGDVQRVEAPALHDAASIRIEGGAHLARIELGAPGDLGGVQSLTLTDLAPLDGTSVLPREVAVFTSLTGLAWSDLTILGGLRRAGHLSIDHSPRLVDLRGLDPSLAIDSLSVGGNDQLASLDGVPPVGRLPGRLLVSHNRVLTSLAGLDGITEVGGPVTIVSNPLLPPDEIERLQARLRAQ